MNNIEDIITDLKKGKMVILVDDEDRENEGDLLIAADHITQNSSILWPNTVEVLFA